MTMDTFGIIGFSEDNVGIDRRIYTGSAINGQTDPVLAVSYNGGRVDVYLNGIKLVGDHSEMPSGTRDYTFTQTGQGSSITIRTGVALVSADVVECIGHVSGSGKTVNTYTPSVSAGDNTFNSSTTGMNGFTLQGSDLLNVYLNGVLLDSSDYTSDASADSVTITSLASGDVVHIQVIGALDYANFVPASGGAFTGPITGVDVNGTELVLDADGDTSITADTDDKIDIKIGGTDVGNFNSNTLKLVKDGTPVLEVEDTAETAYSGFWLTAPEMHFRHSTDNANSAGLLGILRFKGTTKTDIGIASDAGTVEIAQLQARSYEGSSGAGQRFSNVKGGFSFRGMNGSGGLAELMRMEGFNLVLDANGGIDFGGPVNSGGTVSTSNLLDDYEEGTWSPTVSSASGSATLSDNSGLNHSEGWYTKIGRMVFCQMFCQLNTTSGLSSGLRVSNLPFPVSDLLANTGVDGFGYFNYFGNMATSVSSLTILGVGGASYGEIYKIGGSGSTSMSTVDHTHISSTFNWRGYLAYATT